MQKLKEGVEILLVAPCYRKRDKQQPDGPLGSYADLTFYTYVLLCAAIAGVRLYSSDYIIHQILYNNQINARALIDQSAMGYCASKPMRKSHVF